MQTNPNPKRIVIFVIVILVTLISVASVSILFAGSNSKATAGSGSAVTAPPVYAWDVGSNTTLAQATQSVAFKISMPTYLPNDSKLSEVRILPGGESVMLGYTSSSLSPIYGNSQGLGIVIVEEASASPPSSSSSLLPIVIQTTYPNGTTITETNSQTTNTPSYTIIDGKNVVATESNGVSSLVWWSGGVFYQLASSLPLSSLTQVARSMGL